MLFSSVALRNASRIGLRRFPSANATGAASPVAVGQLRHKTAGTGGIPAPILSQWYNIFGKSTIGYATWLVAGILVAEAMTGAASDAVWNTANAGRTFDTVDWTKFKTDDDEEDEDDDEDDEEEEEEEEGDDEDDD